MEAPTIQEIEAQYDAPNDAQNPALESPRTSVAILVRDATNQRLIESAAAHLELVPILMEPDALDQAALGRFELEGFEMIIADEAIADTIAARFLRDKEATLNPALVVVREREADMNHRADQAFDGVLLLPLEPAPLLARLSLILYAHRAFARRFHSALEELHLNRRIFRSVTNGISVADATLPDLPLVYVNPAFEVMTRYSLEEVVGRNCRFLQNGDNDQPGLAVVREAIREKREAVTVLKNYRKDGSFFWNELSLSPIQNRDGVVTHFVGIQTDVTARVEFEAALRESEKLAAVGRLASSIAHEINNPLESVMNLLYLSQNTEDLPEMRRYLWLADQELRQVALITAHSLRFYKQSTRPTAIQPGELMESVLSMYSRQVENAHVSVSRRDRPSQPFTCLESEVRQVLNNLVRNAIDAMRGPGGRLIVRTRNATDWRSGVHGILFTVADTGSGIGPETMKQIYTAFFTTKGIGGTGLGLWISSEIVARHSGRLLVRSRQRPGASGTVFQLFLPFQAPPSAPPPTHVPDLSAGSASDERVFVH
jgi:PAS domain S-box-containing protein